MLLLSKEKNWSVFFLAVLQNIKLIIDICQKTYIIKSKMTYVINN